MLLLRCHWVRRAWILAGYLFLPGYMPSQPAFVGVRFIEEQVLPSQMVMRQFTVELQGVYAAFGTLPEWFS